MASKFASQSFINQIYRFIIFIIFNIIGKFDYLLPITKYQSKCSDKKFLSINYHKCYWRQITPVCELRICFETNEILCLFNSHLLNPKPFRFGIFAFVKFMNPLLFISHLSFLKIVYLARALLKLEISFKQTQVLQDCQYYFQLICIWITYIQLGQIFEPQWKLLTSFIWCSWYRWRSWFKEGFHGE